MYKKNQRIVVMLRAKRWFSYNMYGELFGLQGNGVIRVSNNCLNLGKEQGEIYEYRFFRCKNNWR